MTIAADGCRGTHQPGTGAHVDRRPGRKPTPDELRLVAAVYWFQHASWGTPRPAVMAIWGLSRTSANRWISKAAELYPMPACDGEAD